MIFQKLLLFPLIIQKKRLFSSTKLFSSIKNIDKPACINCKFYKTEKFQNFDSIYNKCSKFGSKNIHNDIIYYDSATSCRENNEKCGEEGLYFQKEENLILKKINHHFSYNFIIYFTTTMLSLFILGQISHAN